MMGNGTLIFVFVILAVANGQRPTVTRTTTLTLTKTSTFYISTYELCASMTTSVSAVVTNCRRRRQYWIDVPVYIALDEELDDQQLTQFFINPSNTYPVEPTASPGIAFINMDEIQQQQPGDDYEFFWFVNPGGVSRLQGSLLSPFSTVADVMNERKPAPLGFDVIINAINNALISLGVANPTKFITDTTTTWKSTTIKTTTATKTIFISGCLPSPFPFSTCKPASTKI